MDIVTFKDASPVLPPRWGRKRLAELIEARESVNPAKMNSDEFFYVDIEALDNAAQRITAPKRLKTNAAPSRARVAIRKGDVIFSLVRPYLKNIAVVPGHLDEQVASTAFCQLRPKADVDSRFIFFQLIQDSFISSIPTYGNSPPAARDDEFLDISVVFAPPEAQQAVVGKIEELFSDLDAGVAALKRAQTNLKRYRAALLKAAVEGRLTGQWRAERKAKGIATEPAAQLLARILLERRKKWEAAQQKKFADAGKAPSTGWQKNYPDPAAPDASHLRALPEGWCWVSVDTAGNVLLGRQRAPQYVTGRFPHRYLRVANIKDDRIDYSDLEEMDFDETHFAKYRLEIDDILVSEGQSPELVGQSAIYRGEIDNLCFQKTLHRFRAIQGQVLTEFAQTVFRAHVRSGLFKKIASITTNIAHLTLEKFCASPFPLAPLSEQTEIVAQVEAKLSNIAQAETEIKRSLERAARLRQAILKRAFEGRLV